MEIWGLSGGMPIDLNPDGSVTIPGGHQFRRSAERVKRSNGQAAIDAGAPLLTSMYPDGLFLFLDGDAFEAWTQILPRLVVGKVGSQHDLIWKGHVWVADDASRLVQVEGYH